MESRVVLDDHAHKIRLLHNSFISQGNLPESFTSSRFFLRRRRYAEERVCPGASELFAVLCSFSLDGRGRRGFCGAGDSVCVAKEHAHKWILHWVTLFDG